MTRPIRPDEIPDIKQKITPPEVFEAFNELIVKNFNYDVSSFRKIDVVQLIADKMKISTRNVQQTWLHVEDMYRNAGWLVELETPEFTESFPAYFIFKKRKQDQ